MIWVANMALNSNKLSSVVRQNRKDWIIASKSETKGDSIFRELFSQMSLTSRLIMSLLNAGIQATLELRGAKNNLISMDLSWSLGQYPKKGNLNFGSSHPSNLSTLNATERWCHSV